LHVTWVKFIQSSLPTLARERASESESGKNFCLGIIIISISVGLFIIRHYFGIHSSA
jgi:hypothetical protein